MENKKNKEIDSLVEFIKQVTSNPVDEGYVRFYRGQSVDKEPIPNLFREKCFEEKEDEMFYEIINRKPEEFANCKCAFDYLVKMQHYGIPTRLLDITSNPLVALFFALSTKELTNFQPVVYYFDIPVDQIKNYNSDSVTVLSNLAKVGKDIKDVIYNDVDFIMNIFAKIYTYDEIEPITESIKLTLLDLKLDNSSYYLKNRFDISNFHSIAEIVGSNIFKSHFDIRESKLSQLLYIESPELLHQLKQDKPYFKDIINAVTFGECCCVKPRQDNPRVIKQNGAFLIYPFKNTSVENLKLTIDPSKKDTMLAQLSMMDMTEHSLYGDIDRISVSIKDNVRKNYKEPIDQAIREDK